MMIPIPSNTVTVLKPWGQELIYRTSNEYLFKQITLHKDCRVSLQHHEFKSETLVVLEGVLNLTIITPDSDIPTEWILNPGDSFFIPAGTIHRMTGITDCVYNEASSFHPDDIVRHSDDYGRN